MNESSQGDRSSQLAEASQQLQRQAAQLSVLSEVGRAIVQQLELDQLLEVVYAQIRQIMPVDTFFVGLYDAEGGLITCPFVYDEGRRYHEASASLFPRGELRQAIDSGEPLFIERTPAEVEALIMAPQSVLGGVKRPAASLFYAPLRIGQRVVGVVSVQSYSPNAYEQQDVVLLTSVVNQVSVAIENARLFELAQAKLTETAALYQATKEISEVLDLDVLVESIAEEARRLVNASCSLVATLDPKVGTIEHFKPSGVDVDQCPVGMKPEGRGILGFILEGKVVRTADVSEHPHAVGLPGWHSPIRSLLGLPLFYRGEPRGVLLVANSPDQQAFDEKDERTLSIFAAQAAIAIENRRLFAQTQQQLADLTTIQRAISELNAALTFEEAINALLPQVAGVVRADTVSMFLIEGNRMTRVGVYSTTGGDDLRIGQVNLLSDYPLTKRVVETRQALALTADDPRLQDHARKAFEAAGVTANAMVPLVGREGVLGTLAVSLHQSGRVFTEHDLNVLQTFANQATIAFEKGLLLEQIRHRTVQLQTAAQVSRAVTSILYVDQLVNESVNLIRDHFDLYYVGLFLVDEDGKSAVLRAGTGEAGRAMLESGHELEVGGESMIGQCVAHRQARIALDVSQETGRFDNPLLPNTHSEMALPLVSHGEVIGALTVQSEKEAAFSDEDVAALQGMADQIANAIANARQFKLLEGTRAQMDKRVRELDCLNDIGRRLEETPPVAELLAWLATRIPPVMQFPSQCVVAIEYQDQIYGALQARTLRCQVVQSLYAGNGIAGRIYVAYIEKHDFLDEESALLGDIARRVSGYIENQQLLRETQARAEALAVLNEMGQALTACLDVESVLNEVYRGASHLVDTTNFYIALYDPERDEVAFVFETSKSEIDRRITVIPASQGITGYIIRNRTSVLLKENPLKWLAERGLEMVGEVAHSWLGVPLVVGDQVLGVMAVQSHTTSRVYDEHDRDLLTAIASQAAIALQNARLFEQTQARAEELAVLNEMSRDLSSMRQVEDVIESAYRHISRLLDTTNFYVALYDAERDEVSFPFYAEGSTARKGGSRRAGRGMTEYVLRTNEPLLVRENIPARLEELGIEQLGQNAQSWLGVPMRVGTQVVGVITVQSYTTPRLYDERHRNLLSAIANQVAIAIRSAQLFQQVGVRAEQERLVRTITDRIRRGTDSEAIIRITLQELGQMLGASKSVIRLGTQLQLLSTQGASAREMEGDQK